MGEQNKTESADVLLVEDNPGDIRLIQEAFEEGSIENTLHVAKDGIAALDFCYQRGDYIDAPRPNIILLDLNVPRKGGMDVLEEIRDDPDLGTTPIIILTGSEAQKDVVKSYELCANAYLTKPVDPDTFMETIQMVKRFWLSAVRLP